MPNVLRQMYWAQQQSPDPLPSEYRRVEYIESDVISASSLSGVKYLALPIVTAEYSRCDIDFMPTVVPGGHTYFMGSNYGFAVSVRAASQTLGKWFNATTGVDYVQGLRVKISQTVAVGVKHYLVDDVECHTSSLSADYNNKLFIFALSKQSDTGQDEVLLSERMLSGRCYGVRDWDLDGNLHTDFIPCVRIADSKPGMYDLCGSTCPLTGSPFYINAGAGADFTWGELNSMGGGQL